MDSTLLTITSEEEVGVRLIRLRMPCSLSVEKARATFIVRNIAA